MDIISIDNNGLRNKWDNYVLAHPHGYAYHLYAWREAVEAGYGFTGLYLMATEGTRVCGVLPMIMFKVPLLGQSLVSLPYCDVGGVLADSSRISEALLQEAGRHARKLGVNALLLRQVESHADVEDQDAPEADKVLMRLELPLTSADLLAGFKSKLRSQITKPQRDGLQAHIGGAELIEDFYSVFARNMRDLGSPVHSCLWMRQVLADYGERARVGVVTLPDGTPAAAGMILFTHRTVSIPWASSLREWNHLNPNMLLYWTFLEYSVDSGFLFFDFGRSTPGTGTYRFKAQWGARPIVLHRREILTGLKTKSQGGVARLCRKSAEAAWSRLPLSASNLLGPKLRRYINL